MLLIVLLHRSIPISIYTKIVKTGYIWAELLFRYVSLASSSLPTFALRFLFLVGTRHAYYWVRA